jgi:branched-chain amino acid transport system substrate-binding protein
MSAITRHEYRPNYTFRVSVSDIYADEFLVRYATEVLGARKPGLIADTSSWGDANVAGVVEWANLLNIESPPQQRFRQGDTDMLAQVKALQQDGADSLIMIANATEGAAIVRAMRAIGWNAPIISHWGISGGAFVQNAGAENIRGVYTLQTYSFMGELQPRGKQVFEAYRNRFGVNAPRDILAPVGVAHAYDGMHLLALAIAKAGNTEGPALRDALEQLPPYDGLLKYYNPAFTPEQHDALYANDYSMAIWQDGILVPAPRSRLLPSNQ